MSSSRENAAQKWMHTPSSEGGMILGALQIPSGPDLHLHGEYDLKKAPGKEDKLHEAFRIWEELGLRNEFISACENIPVATACCGMINDTDSTITKLVPILNRGWIHSANARLMAEGAGVRMDAYEWCWSNVSCPNTHILLLRFFECGTSIAPTCSNSAIDL